MSMNAPRSSLISINSHFSAAGYGEGPRPLIESHKA